LYQSAFLEHRIDKESFRAEEPKLRAQLLEAQLELAERRAFPVLILVTGMDGAGKGGVIQRLYEWLDPRHIRTNGYDAPEEAERARPWMWRYWRDLPAKGEIGVVFGSWYNDAIYALAERENGAGFGQDLDAIARFEQMLADDGALIIKFMLVVSDKEQKKRLRGIAKHPVPGATFSRNGPRSAAATGGRPGSGPGRWSRPSFGRRTGRMPPGLSWRAMIRDTGISASGARSWRRCAGAWTGSLTFRHRRLRP
jgi:polyphosphate kinase 2 (PPK2 family)